MPVDWWVAISWAILVSGTSAIVVAYRRGNLELAVGLLFALASISRFGVSVLDSTLRFEQPAVVILVTLLLVRDTRTVMEFVRRSALAVGFAAAYLAIHILASSVSAPDRFESLKIAAWWAISIGGGLTVAVLGYRSGGRLTIARWIVGVGLAQTGVAAIALASEVLFRTNWGVQYHDALVGKAYGLSWEANLFGILVATTLPFAILAKEDGGIEVSRRTRAAIIGVLAVGLGMSYSRGALVAFAAAMIGIALFALVRSQGSRGRAAQVGAIGVLVLATALGTIRLQDVTAGSLGGGSAGKPGQNVTTGDTISIRLRSIETGLEAIPEQPLIGHGTDSFGQTHTENSCRCPAQISNFVVASLYEVGLIGSLALGGFLLAVAMAIRRTQAVALGAAVIAMLVGYLITDALRFETSWILLSLPLGAAAALQIPRAASPPRVDHDP